MPKPKHKQKKQRAIQRKYKPLRRNCVRCKKKRVSPRHHRLCEKCWKPKKDFLPETL